MDEKKVFGIIAVVAVIILAAYCGIAILKKDSNNEYKADVTGNVPVFGNANNDDYMTPMMSTNCSRSSKKAHGTRNCIPMPTRIRMARSIPPMWT